jgi:hypothetical protein
MRTSVRCMVCETTAEPYFTKDFEGAFGLRKCEYWRCSACGFAYSKTHFEMDGRQWSELNKEYHATYQGTDGNDDDPNWQARLVSQQTVIAQLHAAGALPTDRPWLDWGAGDGSLSKLLSTKGIKLRNYDKFMAREDYCTDGDLRSGAFDFVITTSVFEHVMDVRILDQISDLVSSTGVLGLHTMVREDIPRDPSWFYLLPVHVSFFTNRSMEILFQKWRFASSIYHLPSRLWFFLRSPGIDVYKFADSGNAAAGEQVFFAKDHSFMDYWKS